MLAVSLNDRVLIPVSDFHAQLESLLKYVKDGACA